MTREQLRNIEIPGEVVDINDPYKKGRIRVKVTGVYDKLEDDTIPWASPLKEPHGKSFRRPDVGQVVSVRFEDGDWYRPFYYYADHYNLNLQKKLEELGDEEYKKFSAFYFDDAVQMFKDNKKFVLDYGFNQLILDDSTMNMALKDNFGKIKLGTENADQQAVLGNNYFDWMDTLINVLFKPYLGNSGAPVVPDPALIQVLNQYYALRNTTFLSDNVDIVDNGAVAVIDRINEGQVGDKWTSTVKENEITVEEVTVPPPKDIPPELPPEGTVTTNEDVVNTDIIDEPPADPVPAPQPEREGVEDRGPLIARAIIRAMASKGYVIEDAPYKMNIVGVRNQYPGQPYSNKFIDKMFLIYKKEDGGDWTYKSFVCSTLPGKTTKGKDKHVKQGLPKSYVGKYLTMKKWCSYVRKKGLGILAPGQYINVYYMTTFLSARAMKTPSLPDGLQYAYRDQNWNSNTITYTYRDNGSRAAMYIHKAYNGSSVSKSVGNWSEGCQVFPSAKILNEFFDTCELHKNKHGNKFHYTLMTSEDVNKAKSEIEAEQNA